MERKITEAVEKEEKAKMKKETKIVQQKNTDYSSFIKQYKEKGRKKKKVEGDTRAAQTDTLLERLKVILYCSFVVGSLSSKNQFFSELFIGLVVFRFTSNIKTILQKAYNGKKYSIIAEV